MSRFMYKRHTICLRPFVELLLRLLLRKYKQMPKDRVTWRARREFAALRLSRPVEQDQDEGEQQQTHGLCGSHSKMRRLASVEAGEEMSAEASTFRVGRYRSVMKGSTYTFHMPAPEPKLHPSDSA